MWRHRKNTINKPGDIWSYWKLMDTHGIESPSQPPEGTNSVNILISDFSSPELWDNKYLSLKPPSLVTLLWQSQDTTTSLFAREANINGYLSASFIDWKVSCIPWLPPSWCLQSCLCRCNTIYICWIVAVGPNMGSDQWRSDGVLIWLNQMKHTVNVWH